MERVQETENTIEVFENDMQMYLRLFCEENQIEYMKRESQSVWNSCLRYIYRNVFKDTDKLKSHNNIINNNTIASNYNAYNYDMVLKVLDIYVYDMCMRYSKEVSIIGFSTLTGIDESVIYDWGNNSTKLSNMSAEIYKKLSKMREESLSNKLADGRQNPVGVLAILNRHYQWNLPGVSKENASDRRLGVDQLPKLGQNATDVVQIEQKENDG